MIPADETRRAGRALSLDPTCDAVLLGLRCLTCLDESMSGTVVVVVVTDWIDSEVQAERTDQDGGGVCVSVWYESDLYKKSAPKKGRLSISSRLSLIALLIGLGFPSLDSSCATNTARQRFSAQPLRHSAQVATIVKQLSSIRPGLLVYQQGIINDRLGEAIRLADW